ncbi:MAG TPA: helix-turn-helix domain-containing protein, partial [Polyangia bacterium]|nr:helix-turn-helix domain-containing protein [Polyangia bacterium]
ALARFDQVTLDDLPQRVRAYRADRFVLSADQADEIVTLEEIERRYMRAVLALTGGNKLRAAEQLGITRQTLAKRLGEE